MIVSMELLSSMAGLIESRWLVSFLILSDDRLEFRASRSGTLMQTLSFRGSWQR